MTVEACPDIEAAVERVTTAEQTFAIGTVFTTRGKHPRLCRVTDILRTYNDAGDLVRIRYVAEHEFCGQTVTDYDVPRTTVALGVQALKGDTDVSR